MSRSKGESAQSSSRGDAAASSDAAAAGGMLPTRGSSLPPGTMLGKYRIVRALGAGGMAAVYEALHTGIGKPVAIKTLRALSTDERAEARFLREAAAASRLDHPHVVDVTDFGTERGLSYIVMELLRGEDMGAVLEREKGKLDPAFAADVMLAVCAGVFAAHESGVIHRDLKPQNIFLARTPLGELVPKVLDFGISKRLDEDVGSGLTNSGALLGTTHYLSPEQVAGKQLDVRSDQYSLGVILYEALTGRKPHDGASAYAIMHSIGEGSFAQPRKIRPDISSAMEAVVVRAMSLRPQERFESVHELGRALLPHASSKKRVIWSDYYERDRPPVSPGAPPSYPNPPRPPVAEENTAALAGGRGKKHDQTRTRVLQAARPMAATRVAMPAVPPPAAIESRAQSRAQSHAHRDNDADRPAHPRSTSAGRSGGLRRAVVITGLIALGAGGYAAWVDPDIAERIPQDVKAGIKRATEGRRNLPTAPQPQAAPRPQSFETRIVLSDKPIPIQGGLLPPSPEELEAQKAATAAEQPDASPPGGEPASETAAEIKNPDDLAAAGSPEPDLVAPAPVRPGQHQGARRVVGPQGKPAGGQGERVAPYNSVDATTRALRVLGKKQRREPVWTDPARTRTDETEPPPPPPRKIILNPAGAPILE
jgi:eukaryotic-like serine/threonine-protein kinase